MTDATPMTDTERALLAFAAEMGALVTGPWWASAELAARVTTRKPLDDFTVGELRDLLRAYLACVRARDESLEARP